VEYVKLRYCFVLAALALAGCGKQERNEALQLAKVLKSQEADFNKANEAERTFVTNARGWCAVVTKDGAGRGKQLEQNAATAVDLAQAAVAVSNQLGVLRMAVNGPTLTEEFPQSIRDNLIGDLTRRQRTLQEMRASLQEAAPEFLAYEKIKNFAGDTYPQGVAKLNAMLGPYSVPVDLVGSALASLREKYNFTAAEL
jgi:hypothetical protein